MKMRYLDVDTVKKISKIGLGTWQFGSTEWGYGDPYAEQEAYAIVRRAVELGGLCKTRLLPRIVAGQGLEEGEFCITL